MAEFQNAPPTWTIQNHPKIVMTKRDSLES